jgi:type VI secretion system protein ImpA
MADINVDDLLVPLSEALPCGPDLEYDPKFLELQVLATGKAEQQFGDTLIAAQEPDWRAMKDQALALMARTRDLRVVMYLLRADTRLSGFTAFTSGVRLLRGLLSQHWAHVHPQLDSTDDNDPTMRLNALAPLGDMSTLLADLRAATIGDARAGLTVRQVELAMGKADPTPSETVPQQAKIAEALAKADTTTPGLLNAMLTVHADVLAVETLIDTQTGGSAGNAQGPELSRLIAITRALANMAKAAQGDAVSDGQTTESTTLDQRNTGSSATATTDLIRTGAIHNRDDAIKALDKVCDWINRHEPTNPAPLLIRRAQRLMTKSFLDIIRDLAPDGLKDVERIAGVEPE